MRSSHWNAHRERQLRPAKQTSATGPTKVQFGIKLQNLTMFRYIKSGTAFRTTFDTAANSNPLLLHDNSTR